MLIMQVMSRERSHCRGSIVFVASIGGLVPFSEIGAYSISKTTLLGLTKVCLRHRCHVIVAHCHVAGVCAGAWTTWHPRQLPGARRHQDQVQRDGPLYCHVLACVYLGIIMFVIFSHHDHLYW